MKPPERRGVKVNEEHGRKRTTEVRERLGDKRTLLPLRRKVRSISADTVVERDGAFMNARSGEASAVRVNESDG